MLGNDVARASLQTLLEGILALLLPKHIRPYFGTAQERAEWRKGRARKRTKRREYRQRKQRR